MTFRVGKRVIGRLGPSEWHDPLTLPGEEGGPQPPSTFGGRVTAPHPSGNLLPCPLQSSKQIPPTANLCQEWWTGRCRTFVPTVHEGPRHDFQLC